MNAPTIKKQKIGREHNLGRMLLWLPRKRAPHVVASYEGFANGGKKPLSLLSYLGGVPKYLFALVPFLALIRMGHQPTMMMPHPQQANGTFHILAGSRLYINGSSNVVKFTCDCDCYDPAQAHPFISQIDENKLYFNRTQIRFGARALDCGHRGINSDMYDALKADDHPNITIELLHSKLPAVTTTDAFNIQALTAITIAGTRRQEWISVHVRRQAPNKYRFTGAKPLSMISFGLEAPRPMGGLIRVSDIIEINLDLLVGVPD